MLYKLSTLVLFLMLAAPSVALAQGTGTLAGTVIDDFDQPLPGANVLIEGTQLGAATDINGNYRVIGIPVGQYNITISFVGYGSVTTENVTISSGSTRELNVQLTEGELLEGLIVEYRRPLIETGAIGVPKVVSGEDIENLPVRGVTNVAALQGSVVAEGGGDELFIRGGRDEEVAYYVDGVKVSSLAQVAVNEQSIQEQEMLIGTIPPQYGDVQSGVISITTKSGSDKFFGSAELITSEVLDDYGYNLGSLSVGGPLYPGRASFFLSAQGELVADDSPWGSDTYVLSDERYNALQQNPQVLRVRDLTTGEETFVDFPVQQIVEAQASDPGFVPTIGAVQQFVDNSAPGQYEIVNFNPINTPNTLTASDFERRRGKDDPRDEFTLNGNVTLNLPADINVRVGGAVNVSDRQSDYFIGDLYNNSLYNRDRGYNDERDSYRGYVRINQRFGTNTFYQLQGEFQDYNRVIYPEGFSADGGQDLLRYGSVETDAYYEVTRCYYGLPDGSSGTYTQQFIESGGNQLPELAALYTFALPGAPASYGNANASPIRYQKDHNQQFRFSANLNTQVSVHQLQIGAEFEKETRRRFAASPYRLARNALLNTGVEDDPNTPRDESTYLYSELQFADVASSVGYYGYNYLGTEEVDDESIRDFFVIDDAIDPVTGDSISVRRNTNIAPYQPIYFAGFASDKIEFGDLVIQLGARVDVFDNNTAVLRDIFSNRPLVRAEDFQACNGVDPSGEGVSFACSQINDRGLDPALYARPDGIGDDYAVYFGGSGSNEGQVVGYRDIEGNFYGADGTPAQENDITRTANGQVASVPLDADTFDEVYTDYEPQVTFMPRVGVSFPVTDRALFFASYNVTSQRPTERAYASFQSFRELTSGSRPSNPGLLPEKTTQYELGFRQRVGERAAVTVSGFYRTQDNKISTRKLDGGLPSYSTYRNVDFTTSKGLELGFDLRRTNNIALNANYTLSYAEGTGSDATATATIAWRGGNADPFPNSLDPADFDQRHTLNASVDYRLGQDEGPELFGARLLENFGLNVLLQYGSGQRYTRIQAADTRSIDDDITSAAIGGINGSTLPSTSRIDLRLDRSFDLGFASSSFKAYLWIQNVLDTQNVIAVYRATGQPDEDGYLQTQPAGPQYLDTEELQAGYAFNYNAFAGGPVNVGGNQSSNGSFFYGLPRRVRLGFLFNF